MARRTALVRVVGDEDEGEGGVDGEGEGDEDEDDEGESERRAERKRGNAPEWFHRRVSSPPSNSRSSSKEDVSSTSVSPSLSSCVVLPDGAVADVFVDAAAVAVVAFVGGLYVGKMRGREGGGTSAGSSVGEDEGERGCGGSRCKLPYARKTNGMLPTPLRCGTVCVLSVICTAVVSSWY